MLDDVAKNAYTAFSKKLAWSFYWLFIGKWPSRDEENRLYDKDSSAGKLGGTTLAGGFYGVLWIIKGDLEHVAKAYKFPWASAASPCACCQANSSDKPWTDGRLQTAEWTKSIWTNASWAAAHPEPHPLFKILPGVGVQAFVPDVMHTTYLGCYQYLFGSVLKSLSISWLPHLKQILQRSGRTSRSTIRLKE